MRIASFNHRPQARPRTHLGVLAAVILSTSFVLLLHGRMTGFSQRELGVPVQAWAALPSHSASQTVTDLAKGKFLVAGKNLLDPNFAETVVLLIEYTADGAMGVVINRPTAVLLSELFPDITALQQRSDRVHLGGPVARMQMLLLVQSPHRPDGAQQVFGDVYVSGSRTLLQQLAGKATAGERFRAYVGYAGWAPGQLDQEVSRGDWYILPATAEVIFDTAPEAVWPELIRRGAVEWTKAPHTVEENDGARFQSPLY